MNDDLRFDKDELERFLMGEMAGQYFKAKRKGKLNSKNFYPNRLSSSIRKIWKIKTMRDNLEIYIYNEEKGIYEPNGRQLLRELIKKALGEYYREYHATAVINDITASTGTDRQELEPPLHLIPLRNGLLNIDREKPTLAKHTPAFFFTGTLPVEYKPNAQCPNFRKFLEQIQPDPINRAQIQEMFGYCLWREYSQQIAFLLIGAGSNGRSTLLTVLEALLGKENVSSETLQSLCHDKFSKAELYHKFANICGDLPSKRIEDTGAFKMLTGGDLVSVQKKHKNPFNLVNYAKLIFLANKVPLSYDDSDAYYRRWILIFFPVRFSIQPGDPTADKHILEKLTTPEELSGILNWALKGLQRLRKQKEFTKTMTVEQTRKYYERLVSPLSAFMQDRIIITYNPDDYLTKEDFYSALQEYCKEKKVVAPTYGTVGRLINKIGKGITTGHKKVRDQQTYVWAGCKFNLTEEEKQTIERQTIDDVWREAMKEG